VKKSVLWYIAICAGAVFCAAVAILAVMYSQNVYSFARRRVANVKSLKDRALLPLTHKHDMIDDI